MADQAFKIVATILWNGLPSHVQSASSVPTFKKLLKTNCLELHIPCTHYELVQYYYQYYLYSFSFNLNYFILYNVILSKY